MIAMSTDVRAAAQASRGGFAGPAGRVRRGGQKVESEGRCV